jgi:hypothetical protein
MTDLKRMSISKGELVFSYAHAMETLGLLEARGSIIVGDGRDGFDSEMADSGIRASIRERML